jgi:RNA polymerase sigma-70 factor (sigma-E family)
VIVGVDRHDRFASDCTGFERWAVRASPLLLRTACLLTRDRGSAEDLLQATLWRVARRWEAINESPDAYAREVLVNLSRDRRRHLRRRPVEAPESPTAVNDQERDVAVGVVERDAMAGAVRRLPRRQREVIVLRFFLDLSVDETAAALGASAGTVKSHTSRALIRLRALLDGDAEGFADPSTEVSHAD